MHINIYTCLHAFKYFREPPHRLFTLKLGSRLAISGRKMTPERFQFPLALRSRSSASINGGERGSERKMEDGRLFAATGKIRARVMFNRMINNFAQLRWGRWARGLDTRNYCCENRRGRFACVVCSRVVHSFVQFCSDDGSNEILPVFSLSNKITVHRVLLKLKIRTFSTVILCIYFFVYVCLCIYFFVYEKNRADKILLLFNRSRGKRWES